MQQDRKKKKKDLLEILPLKIVVPGQKMQQAGKEYPCVYLESLFLILFLIKKQQNRASILFHHQREQGYLLVFQPEALL